MKKKVQNNKKNYSLTGAISDAYRSVKTFLCENHSEILICVFVYFILASASVFITSRADIKENLKTLLGIPARMCIFALFSSVSFLFKRKKTIFSLACVICFAWLAFPSLKLLSKIIITLTAAVICVIFLFAELRKPCEIKNKDKTKKVILWLGYFLGILYLAEAAQQFSVWKPVVSAFQKPDIFILNYMLISSVGLFILVVKRRLLASVLYGLIWGVLAYISYLKSSFINEPLMVLDVMQIRDAIPAAFNFLSIFQLCLIALGIVLIIAAVVFFIIKGKKVTYSGKRTVILVVCFAVSTVYLYSLWHIPYAVSRSNFMKINYRENGFVYSFAGYNIETLRKKPKKYTEQTAENIVEKVVAQYEGKEEKPLYDVKNIIVLQMESFSDPYLALADYPELTYERDSMPYIRSLIENYSSGTVNVPILGGQTVKSEFEFLTGLSIDNLPYGYNPYVTYLYKNSSDSLVRYLEEQGFASTAIHPYEGEFFNRNLVYENIGFDTYVPYEFMSGVEKRETQIWGNDIVLTDLIEEALDKTEGKDFVFNVTIQLHGKYYPVSEDKYCMDIQGVDDENFLGILQYYVNEMEAEDRAIKSLIEMLEKRGEPTVVLFYADHLPSFYANFENMSEDEKFTVQYWTWNNIGLEKDEDRHMELFELSDYFLCEILGYNGSFMNRFRSVFSDDENYDGLFRIIQYYKLFDEERENYASEEDSLKLGMDDIVLTEIIEDTDPSNDISYIIKGEHLTDNTYIVINGKVHALTYVDPETCYLENYKKKIASSSSVFLRIIGEKYGATFAESNKLGPEINEEDE